MSGTRAGAFAVLALALLAWFAFVTPQRAALDAASAEFRRVRDERRDARRRVSELRRAEQTRREANALLARARGASAGPADAFNQARASLVASLEGQPVRGARLSVRPVGRGAAAAAVRLSVRGRYGDVVRFSAHVCRAGSGLVLESVRLTPSADAYVLEVEGHGLGAAP